MGQKSNPQANRLSLTKEWRSRWFSDRSYRQRLLDDLKIRSYLENKFGRAGAVAKIEIARTVGGQIHIIIHTAKPGMVIGRGGAGLAELRGALEKMLGLEVKKAPKGKVKRPGAQEGSRLKIDVLEIKVPELLAKLVAETIAGSIERRLPHRRANRQAIERVMSAGAAGIRIELGGRLGGAEIARREKVTEGSVPLSTFRTDIDFAQAVAQTTYGTIGVKVWINRGPLEADRALEE